MDYRQNFRESISDLSQRARNAYSGGAHDSAAYIKAEYNFNDGMKAVADHLLKDKSYPEMFKNLSDENLLQDKGHSLMKFAQYQQEFITTGKESSLKIAESHLFNALAKGCEFVRRNPPQAENSLYDRDIVFTSRGSVEIPCVSMRRSPGINDTDASYIARLDTRLMNSVTSAYRENEEKSAAIMKMAKVFGKTR